MYRDCVATMTIEDAKVCMRGTAALVSLADVSILLRAVGDIGRGGVSFRQAVSRRTHAGFRDGDGTGLGTRHGGHLRGPGL